MNHLLVAQIPKALQLLYCTGGRVPVGDEEGCWFPSLQFRLYALQAECAVERGMKRYGVDICSKLF